MTPYRRSKPRAEKENEQQLESDILEMLQSRKQISYNVSACNFCNEIGHKAAACLRMVDRAIKQQAGLFYSLRWSKFCVYCFKKGLGKKGRTHSIHCPKVIGFGWTGLDEKDCWRRKEVEKKAEAEKSKEEGERVSKSLEQEDVTEEVEKDEVTEFIEEANAEAEKKKEEK